MTMGGEATEVTTFDHVMGIQGRTRSRCNPQSSQRAVTLFQVNFTLAAKILRFETFVHNHTKAVTDWEAILLAHKSQESYKLSNFNMRFRQMVK